MQKTAVILGIYCHVPDGVSDAVLEDYYQTCYRPFLGTLNRFPEVNAVLHFSGSLLTKLEQRHPEFFMLLEELVGRRQIEILSGAFYAPILPLLPSTDRLGQIELLTTYLRKSFGRRSRGCWLYEYSWEPWLASTMQTCGIDYAFVLHDQIERSGQQNRCGYPFITEDQGRCIQLFPVFDCQLSFPSIVGIEQAVEQATSENPELKLATVFLAGEQIAGLWEASGLESPDVLMERSFAWFRKNMLSIETTLPGKILKQHRTSGRAYFPGMTSQRMLSSIHGDRYDPDKHNGSLRQTVVWHPCARNLYAKVSYVHLQIGQLRGDKARKKTAAENLWTSQGADALWKAPSGGICNPSIRQAAWRGALEAEQITRHKGSFKPGFIYADVDYDGEKEIVWQGTDYNAYFRVQTGSIFIFDYLKARRNLCDVYIEDYLASKAQDGLFTDWLSEAGDSVYLQVKNYHQTEFSGQSESLRLASDLRFGLGTVQPSVLLEKTFHCSRRKITCQYTLHNRGSSTQNLGLMVGHCVAMLPQELEAIRDNANQTVFSETERDAQLEMHCDRPLTTPFIEIATIDTVFSIRLETAQDSVFQLSRQSTTNPDGSQNQQGLLVTCTWHISLEPGESLSRNLDLTLQV